MKYALLLLATIVLALPPAGFAQENTLWPHIAGRTRQLSESWSIGLDVGASLNALSMRAAGATDGSLGELFASGTGAGATIMAYVDYPVTPQFGIRGLLRWDRRSVGGNGATLADCFLALGDFLPPLLLDSVAVQTDFTLTQNFVSLGVAGRWAITPSAWVTAGPSFDIPVGDGTFRVRQHVNEGAACNFRGADGKPRQDVETTFTTPPPARTFHVGAHGSLGYRTPLTSRVGLVGQFTYAIVLNHSMGVFDFTDRTRELSHGVEEVHYTDEFIHTLTASVGLVMDF